MPTDYRAISAYNEEMLGKDRASRMSQVSMYADTAHFVFEILQNADDAGATEVVFEVSEDRLVIEHNGKPLMITWSERHFIRLCALWNAA